MRLSVRESLSPASSDHTAAGAGVGSGQPLLRPRPEGWPSSVRGGAAGFGWGAGRTVDGRGPDGDEVAMGGRQCGDVWSAPGPPWLVIDPHPNLMPSVDTLIGDRGSRDVLMVTKSSLPLTDLFLSVLSKQLIVSRSVSRLRNYHTRRMGDDDTF